ncbi:MAG: PadR family transcriptional regulator [Oscillospiraceae bacterium]
MAKDRKIDMVILGLLAHEDLSGYDIKKHIDSSISFFWKGSFGSIYPSLSAMEKEGLVRKAENSENSGGREKICYSITPDGKKALISWLKDSKAVNDLKYETLLKLFFGGVTDAKTSVNTINAFENEIRESLELLKMYKENLSKVMDNKDHIYYYLTVSFGVETYEGYLKWCKEAKKMLDNLGAD